MTRDHRYSARTDRACRRWTWVSLWPRDFLSDGGLRSCLRQVAELLRLVGGELLGLLLPRDRAPARGREQEVVDVAGRDRARRERVVHGGGVQPLPLGQRVRRVQAAARADQGVAAD